MLCVDIELFQAITDNQISCNLLFIYYECNTRPEFIRLQGTNIKIWKRHKSVKNKPVPLSVQHCWVSHILKVAYTQFSISFTKSWWHARLASRLSCSRFCGWTGSASKACVYAYVMPAFKLMTIKRSNCHWLFFCSSLCRLNDYISYDWLCDRCIRDDWL